MNWWSQGDVVLVLVLVLHKTGHAVPAPPRLRDSGYFYFCDLLNFLSDKLVIELVMTGGISTYNYPISRTGPAIWNSRSVPCGPAVS